MSTVMVRYTVKPGAGEANEELVREVYAELNRTRPAGFHYATFVQPDGVSFVHIATKAPDGDESPLMQVAAFKAFLSGLNDRSLEPPVTVELREVGSFAFWGM